MPKDLNEWSIYNTGSSKLRNTAICCETFPNLMIPITFLVHLGNSKRISVVLFIFKSNANGKCRQS